MAATISSDTTCGGSLELDGTLKTDMDCEVPGFDGAVPEFLATTFPLPISVSIGVASDLGSDGTLMESELLSGLMEGFHKCSKATSAGTASREDPSFDSMSAAQLFVLGICLNSQPSK